MISASMAVTSPSMRHGASDESTAPPQIFTDVPMSIMLLARTPPSSLKVTSNMSGRWTWVSTTTRRTACSTKGSNGAAAGAPNGPMAICARTDTAATSRSRSRAWNRCPLGRRGPGCSRRRWGAEGRGPAREAGGGRARWCPGAPQGVVDPVGLGDVPPRLGAPVGGGGQGGQGLALGQDMAPPARLPPGGGVGQQAEQEVGRLGEGALHLGPDRVPGRVEALVVDGDARQVALHQETRAGSPHCRVRSVGRAVAWNRNPRAEAAADTILPSSEPPPGWVHDSSRSQRA